MFELERFIQAQDHGNAYADALQEVRHGRKRTHWIWYVFPQMKGLGHSLMSDMFGITSLLEAKAYLEDCVLRGRLEEISLALLGHAGESADDIFGPVDAMKVRSCMTLFDLVQPHDIWNRVLEVFYNGGRCQRTLDMTRDEYESYTESVCRRHELPFDDDLFFCNDPMHSITGRSTHLLRLVSNGESAEKMTGAFLWRHDLHPHTREQAASCLASYLRDFYNLAAFRYADDSVKEFFRKKVEDTEMLDAIPMARLFDRSVADILRTPLTAQALTRYIESY